MTITLTPEQIEAIGYALDLAHGDRKDYLYYGSPELDYGEEWKEVAQTEAERFRLLGEVGELLGLRGEKQRWDDLAKECEESA